VEEFPTNEKRGWKQSTDDNKTEKESRGRRQLVLLEVMVEVEEVLVEVEEVLVEVLVEVEEVLAVEVLVEVDLRGRQGTLEWKECTFLLG